MMNLVGSALQGNASDAPPCQGPYEVRERLRALKIALYSQILNGETFLNFAHNTGLEHLAFNIAAPTTEKTVIPVVVIHLLHSIHELFDLIRSYLKFTTNVTKCLEIRP